MVNKPHLYKAYLIDPVLEGWGWVCRSARVKGYGNTEREAWLDWQRNCHTVTKVTQTAIGDGANKDDTSLIATRNEESNK